MISTLFFSMFRFLHIKIKAWAQVGVDKTDIFELIKIANRAALEVMAAYDNAVVYVNMGAGDLYRTACTDHVVSARSTSARRRAAAGSWIMQCSRCHPPVHVMLPDMHRGVTRKCFLRRRLLAWWHVQWFRPRRPQGWRRSGYRRSYWKVTQVN